MKSDAQTISLLQARLTANTAKDVRLAAVTTIRQVAGKIDPECVILLQAGLRDKDPTVSQIAALIRVDGRRCKQ